MRKLLIYLSAAAAMSAVLVTRGPAASAQGQQSSIPPEWGAAGSPIFRPCGEIDASIGRMQAGLNTQQQWIRSAEQQLRDAASGAYASREALRAKAQDALGDLITEQMEAMLTLRRKVEFLKSMGLSKQSRRRVLEAAEHAEQLYERAGDMKERYDALVQEGRNYDFAKALRENTKSLEAFLKFADESGLAEEGVSLLAMAGGPVGELTAATTRAAIDWSLAAGESMISEKELRRAQEDLASLRAAHDRNRGIISDLQGERAAAIGAGQCPEVSAGNRPQPSSLTPPLPDRPIGPPAVSPPAPPAPPAPKGEEKKAEQKKSGMGDTVFYGILAAGVGGAYLYSEYQKTQGAQCVPPSMNPLTCAATYGGGAAICVQVRAEQEAYCKCNGLGYAGGQCTG